MSTQAFITAQEAINIAWEDKTFSTDYIQDNIIIECQESNILTPLGKLYYKELMTQFAANDSSYTAANKFIVVNYLKKAIAYYVKAKIYPNQAAKLTNAGVVANDPDPYTKQAGDAAAGKAGANSTQSGDFWLNSALQYMEDDDNKLNYPTYNNNLSSDRGSQNFNTFRSWVNL